MIALPIGEPESADIKSGLGRALQQAERLELSNVFVPALATNWVRQVDNRAMKLGEVFDTIFDAITPGEYPKQIYISLYKTGPRSSLRTRLRP